MSLVTVFLDGTLYNGSTFFMKWMKPSLSVDDSGILSLTSIYTNAFVTDTLLAPPAKKNNYNEYTCTLKITNLYKNIYHIQVNWSLYSSLRRGCIHFKLIVGKELTI